jgi:alkyl hydroperoxide reductase subunit F
VKLANGGSLKGRTVILSTGARWRNVNVPGEQPSTATRAWPTARTATARCSRASDVAVIGGGNSGVEAAIDLAGVVRHVTVIEFMPELKADAVLVAKLHSLPNVTVHTNAQTTEITGDGGKVNGLRYKDRATGEEHLVPLAGVFVQIGLVPNTEWLKGTLELSKFGEIVIDAKGQTSDCRACSPPATADHGAVQADRHRRRRRRQGGAVKDFRVRPPDPHAGLGRVGRTGDSRLPKKGVEAMESPE